MAQMQSKIEIVNKTAAMVRDESNEFKEVLTIWYEDVERRIVEDLYSTYNTILKELKVVTPASITLVTGTESYNIAKNFHRLLGENTVWMNVTSTDERFLTYLDYEEYINLHVGDRSTSGEPTYYTIVPSADPNTASVMHVWYAPSSTYNGELVYYYYSKYPGMSQDVSDIRNKFAIFYGLLVEGALYRGMNDILSMAQSMYTAELDKMAFANRELRAREHSLKIRVSKHERGTGIKSAIG